MNKFPNDRQLDLKDCGPACLKMIAKHYGKYYSIQYLRDKCGLTKEGISFLDISYCAEEIGLRTISITCTIDDLFTKIPLPAIVHWGKNHFVVVYKTTSINRNKKSSTRDRIYVSDPSYGYIKYSRIEFAANWLHGKNDEGVLMAIEPQADFKQREGSSKIERFKTVENLIAYFVPYKKSFINLCVIMLVVTVLQGLLPFISKAVIDVGIQTQDIDFINIVLFANIAIIVSILLSNMVRDWILMHITARVNIAMVSDYLIKLMRLPITFFENKMMGDILQRAQDHERIRSFLMNNSLNLVFSGLTFVIFAVVIFFYNTTVFWIFILGSTLYVAWVMSFLQIRKKLDWEYFELVSMNQSYWVEIVSSIQDIKINNYEKQKRWKWEKIQARLYAVNVKVLSVTNAQNLGAQFIDSLKNLCITFFCAKAVIKGEVTFGVMISIQFIIGMLNAPVAQLIQFIISYQFAKLSFLRLNEIHQLQDEHEHVATNNIELPKNKSLVLKNVSFQYNNHGIMILKGITLTIPEGKVTAIVGDSGSGKSTLLKLLLRMYNPTHGEIQMGEMNINNVSLRQWRDTCGAVLQDGRIFNDTILNNVVLESENVDYERLRKAISAANIGSEIEQLPLGYQTVMGEQGRGLSGGQKQRILIARALYKDPHYLFFDEATNSLDTINEQKIVSALDEVFKEKTVVVVAHRLSTIQKADQIIVMYKGMVVEIGNHDSLMHRRSKYFDLVQAQIRDSNSSLLKVNINSSNEDPMLKLI